MDGNLWKLLRSDWVTITETCFKIDRGHLSDNTRHICRKNSKRTIVKPEQQTSLSKDLYFIANV